MYIVNLKGKGKGVGKWRSVQDLLMLLSGNFIGRNEREEWVTIRGEYEERWKDSL